MSSTIVYSPALVVEYVLTDRNLASCHRRSKVLHEVRLYDTRVLLV